MAEIVRSSLETLDVRHPVTIEDVKQLSSYSWIEGSSPKIAVPGLPPLWTPLKGPQQLEKDSGLAYIAQNIARHPESPMEPLFRSLFITCPSFNLGSIDVVTDRNNIRKLLQFINPGRDSHKLEAFTINAEVHKETVILDRTEVSSSEIIGPHEFRGFGREYERKYTTTELGGTRGHHRILSYRFCRMNFIIRHETDGYLDNSTVDRPGQGSGGLSDMLSNLTLASEEIGRFDTFAGSGLRVGNAGHPISPESILEIKTRTKNKPLSLDEVAPQLWISQTPKLVRAYHDRGKFLEPKVEDVSTMIRRWEAANQSDLMKLGGLIRQIISTAKELGGKVTIRYDNVRSKLSVEKNHELPKMLPEDLYAKWNTSGESSREESEEQPSPDTDISLNMDSIRNDTPFASVIRSGMDKGFRQIFRDMPTNLGDYLTLCNTLKATNLDILQGRQIRDLMGDLRSGKEDFDPDERRQISGTKTVARDSAFRLLYALLQEEFEDRNAAYNATLFVVSHFRIFKYKTRKMVRQAFESTCMPSAKQKRELDRWMVEEVLEEDDTTTEEEPFSDFWDSDYP